MILEILAPAPWFTPNGRRHWAATNALVQDWRAAAWGVARNARAAQPAPYFTVPVVITATIHKTTARLYDPANLLGGSCKAAIDGIVDAGILAGDDPRYIAETRIRAGSKRAQDCLVLEVNPA